MLQIVTSTKGPKISTRSFNMQFYMQFYMPVHAIFARRARMQACMQAYMRGLNEHSLQSMRRVEWVDIST